jgi:acyl transferase domain-containing protein
MSDTQSIPWWRGQEELVISGVSGRFPEADNVDEFAEHLFAGNDLITEDSRRWEPGAVYSHGRGNRTRMTHF